MIKQDIKGIIGGSSQVEMNRILITGPNNPLAQNILNQIIENYPKSEILTLSRGNCVNNFQKLVKHYSIDLGGSIPTFNDIDMLIHTASCVPATAESNNQFMRVNYEGSMMLIEKINFNSDAKILNISSSSVYDDSSVDVLDENSIKTIENPYGLSKLMFEKFLENFFNNSSINFLSVRVPVLLIKNVQNNFISKWKKNIEDGKPITIFNPNSNLNACFLGSDIFPFFLNYVYHTL